MAEKPDEEPTRQHVACLRHNKKEFMQAISRQTRDSWNQSTGTFEFSRLEPELRELLIRAEIKEEDLKTPKLANLVYEVLSLHNSNALNKETPNVQPLQTSNSSQENDGPQSSSSTSTNSPGLDRSSIGDEGEVFTPSATPMHEMKFKYGSRSINDSTKVAEVQPRNGLLQTNSSENSGVAELQTTLNSLRPTRHKRASMKRGASESDAQQKTTSYSANDNSSQKSIPTIATSGEQVSRSKTLPTVKQQTVRPGTMSFRAASEDNASYTVPNSLNKRTFIARPVQSVLPSRHTPTNVSATTQNQPVQSVFNSKPPLPPKQLSPAKSPNPFINNKIQVLNFQTKPPVESNALEKSTNSPIEDNNSSSIEIASADNLMSENEPSNSGPPVPPPLPPGGFASMPKSATMPRLHSSSPLNAMTPGSHSVVAPMPSFSGVAEESVLKISTLKRTPAIRSARSVDSDEKTSVMDELAEVLRNAWNNRDNKPGVDLPRLGPKSSVA